MSNFVCVVFCILIFDLKPTGAFPRSGLDTGGSRTRRGVLCSADTHYQHDNICCLNCPAGTHVKSPCNRERERGECEECEHGTFTEHSNGLGQCFKCTRCRTDQEVVRPCSSTQDTQCQCKSGRFCVPEEACEVCKKCSSCEEDEEVVRICTPTSNTECKKKTQPNPGSLSATAGVIVPLVLVAGLLCLGLGFWWWKRSKGSQSHLPGSMKDAQHHPDSHPTKERRNGETRKPILALVRPKSSAGTEDERKVLCCESLNSSASNSQHSLTSLPCSPAFPAPPAHVSPMVPRQPNWREEEPFPKLTPMKGEESLRKCFAYFEEEVEVTHHKRFFRHLDISDNVIKSAESLHYEDRMHELLRIWVEKVGRDASLNDLLNALLVLNQRRTAEIIRERAIQDGHYVCENRRDEDVLSESPSEKTQS